MIKQGDVITVELHVECNDWCEPIHVHFDNECPICNKNYTGTDMYDSPDEYINEIFQCNNCDSKFKLLSWDYPEAVVEVVEIVEVYYD